jgi:predicted ferric reductase
MSRLVIMRDEHVPTLAPGQVPSPRSMPPDEASDDIAPSSGDVAPPRAQASKLTTVVWATIYLVLAAAPLAASLISLDPGRGFWVNLSVALGFVALALLGLQFALAARSAKTTTPFGIDVVLQFHRQVTGIIVLFVLAHPIILFIWDDRFLKLLNIWTSPMRAKFGVTSVIALAVLAVTSVYRSKLRISYPVWQALHAALALTIVITALAHVLLIGYYVDEVWEKALWIAYSAIFVWIGVWVRLVKPLQRVRRRLRVVEVRQELGGCHTLVLEPVHPASFGPKGLRFAPGQFAWILLGRSPFAMTYHPFSFASSAERTDQICFTVKAFGAFTSGLHDVQPGQTVYLDGPWGNFTPDRHPARGLVLIAGGVGITPMLSTLLTLEDRSDPRPRWLFYAARDEQSLTCRGQLDALASAEGVTIVYVLSKPSADWAGERGHIDAALLERLLPADRAELQFFICGPEGMMDAAEAAALATGAPPQAVHSERFAMA